MCMQSIGMQSSFPQPTPRSCGQQFPPRFLFPYTRSTISKKEIEEQASASKPRSTDTRL